MHTEIQKQGSQGIQCTCCQVARLTARIAAAFDSQKSKAVRFTLYRKRADLQPKRMKYL